VFGAGARKHPIAGFMIEQGSGPLPVEEQLANNVRKIEWTEGPDAVAVLRRKLADAESALRPL